MKHTIKLLTLAFMLATILTLTGCPGPVNNYIEPPVWDDGVVTTEPTCTEEGVKTYTCSNGETRTETIPALGHDMGDWVWGEWTTTKEMTYQQDEEKTRSGTRTCKRCGHTENKTQTEVTSRFVAGGYDGNDVPTENAETYRYQYNGENDYQIYAYVYSSVEDALADENKEVLYFSFPNDTTGISQIVTINGHLSITIDNLLKLKGEDKTVKYYSFSQSSLPDSITFIDEYPEYLEDPISLIELVGGSPIYVILE